MAGRICQTAGCDADISDRPAQARYCAAHATNGARKRRQREVEWVRALLHATAADARAHKTHKARHDEEHDRFRCRCARVLLYYDWERDACCLKCGRLIDPANASRVNWGAEADVTCTGV